LLGSGGLAIALSLRVSAGIALGDGRHVVAAPKLVLLQPGPGEPLEQAGADDALKGLLTRASVMPGACPMSISGAGAMPEKTAPASMA